MPDCIQATSWVPVNSPTMTQKEGKVRSVLIEIGTSCQRRGLVKKLHGSSVGVISYSLRLTSRLLTIHWNHLDTPSFLDFSACIICFDLSIHGVFDVQIEWQGRVRAPNYVYSTILSGTLANDLLEA